MRAHETLERAGRHGGFPARGSASGLFAPWQAFDLAGAVLADLFLARALLRGDGGAPGPDYR